MDTNTRRTVTRAALWSAPVVLAAAATPAVAASVPVQDGNLEVTVQEPNMNWATLQYVQDDTIYKNTVSFFDQTRQPRPEQLTTVATNKASLPPSITVTNKGTTAISNPTGTAEFEMRDYGSDYSPLGSDQVGAVSTNPQVTWTRTSTGRSATEKGQMYSYVYNGTLAPGESVGVRSSTTRRGPSTT